MEIEKRLGEIIAEAEGTWGVVVEELGSGHDQKLCFKHLPAELFIAESVIKVPIMAAVYEAADKGQFSVEDHLTLRKEDLVGGSGFLYRLSPGLRLTIRDLITMMIIQSDNTATNMLIDLVGEEQIKQTMCNLGMSQSRYSRKLMIYPVDVAENNLISAGDVASMLGKIASGTFLSQRACAEMIAIMNKQQVVNGLPSLLPDQADAGENHKWTLPCKSGWDTGRQHDVGVLYTAGRRITITALSQDVQPGAALRTLGLLGKAVYDYSTASESCSV
ncbi:serine hydrolase [Brevibacillus reuszeri]|uniref:serine hydrolase n=1 Tax=Brevibacillus reuszeri TaxID=54915 RepID=UPI0028979598|nr:serine hydrolase [Brevibacillus reuszeri]